MKKNREKYEGNDRLPKSYDEDRVNFSRARGFNDEMIYGNRSYSQGEYAAEEESETSNPFLENKEEDIRNIPEDVPEEKTDLFPENQDNIRNQNNLNNQDNIPNQNNINNQDYFRNQGYFYNQTPFDPEDTEDYSNRIVVDMTYEEQYAYDVLNNGSSKTDKGKKKRSSVEKPGNNPVLKEIFDWVKHIVLAIALGLFLVLFVVQRNEVVGTSMVPNLHNGDQLFVQKISKLVPDGISRGDIITVHANGLYPAIRDKNIIKRVVGLPGETVCIHEGEVYIDGIPLSEDYIDDRVKTFEKVVEFSEVKLNENEYYVLGDNREGSLDSRTFGPITKDRIIGEVLFRFLPLKDFGVP